MMISNLPGDLLEEILCRVPATSVKPLRSTCKRWKRLLNDNRFARWHLSKSAKQFLVLDLKKLRVCSMSVNLHGNPSIEVIGKVNPKDSQLNSAQINIKQVASCDGLLVCSVKKGKTRGIIVWNPCTGQTKWIQPSDRKGRTGAYSLGSYQDNKPGNTSYKVLRRHVFSDVLEEFEICHINSNSWRTIDAPGCHLNFNSVSLKGKTYWFATSEEHVFLVSFDYTRERFERLSLPNNGCLPKNRALSVVRQEKLSMLLQRPRPQTLKYEIWVTNKIDDETEALSWINIFTVDYPEAMPSVLLSYFVVDEEKKAVLMSCRGWENKPGYNELSTRIYVVGENSRAGTGFGGRLYNYVPSLIQFH